MNYRCHGEEYSICVYVGKIAPWPNLFDCVNVQCQMAQFQKNNQHLKILLLALLRFVKAYGVDVVSTDGCDSSCSNLSHF